MTPTRNSGAGGRLHQMMGIHLQERFVELAFLARQDRVNRSCHVVVDPIDAAPAKELESRVMRIKYHLLCIARIGNGEWHPARAQFDVSNLHCGKHIGNYNLFFAPVELVGLPRINLNSAVEV